MIAVCELSSCRQFRGKQRDRTMKSLFVMVVVALVACTAAAPQQFQQYRPLQQQQQQQQQVLRPVAPRQQSYAPAAPSEHIVNIAQARTSAEEPIVIIRQVQDFALPGTYSYSYETENGIQASEAGELRNIGTDAEANAVQGSFSYTGPDGVVYTTSYVADENGFRADGAHLPVPPPVPEEIQKAIDYARSQPGFREEDDGQYKKE